MGKCESVTPAKLQKEIKKLEQKMLKHAQNLEFEEAAHMRDQIKRMQEGNMGIS